MRMTARTNSHRGRDTYVVLELRRLKNCTGNKVSQYARKCRKNPSSSAAYQIVWFVLCTKSANVFVCRSKACPTRDDGRRSLIFAHRPFGSKYAYGMPQRLSLSRVRMKLQTRMMRLRKRYDEMSMCLLTQPWKDAGERCPGAYPRQAYLSDCNQTQPNLAL